MKAIDARKIAEEKRVILQTGKVETLLLWIENAVKESAEKGWTELEVNLLDIGLKGLVFADAAKREIITTLVNDGFQVDLNNVRPYTFTLKW